jgi:decaprenylphospho-beta-D-ribofuranose 2-oxidase
MRSWRDPVRRGWAGLALLAVAGLAFYASTFVVSWGGFFRERDALDFEDIGRVEAARVDEVRFVQSVDDIREALEIAASRGLKVSIAGSRHSQGGQTFAKNAIVLDMRGFNRVLAVDPEAMTVTVQSGATWDQLQHAIAPFGLALKVMQSSNIFTVGGSLSANAHGRDIDLTRMVDVVERFAIMLADGSVAEVSRNENAELFSLVIGGYGLYGVILDVTLRLTTDELYEQKAVNISYTEFPDYFVRDIQPDPDIRMMIARPSIDRESASYLREMVVVTWQRTAAVTEGAFELSDESHVFRDRFFFGLSRRFDWAKSLRWRLQKRLEPTLSGDTLVSRNNAMRPPVAPLEFLDYYSARDSDILQEYFIPLQNFTSFMNVLREKLVAWDANILSVTVRFVAADDPTVLAYVPDQDAFAVVLLLNVGLSDEEQDRTRSLTRDLVDAALDDDGSYYLTYQLYPTFGQFLRAYPGAEYAFERKRYFDPAERFSSLFYEHYAEGLRAR